MRTFAEYKQLNAFAQRWLSPDVLLLWAMVAAANTHLLGGSLGPKLVFIPSLVVLGEWWRVITYPFVHITWYHLALDAGGFFMLYRELRDVNLGKRFFYVVWCGALSLGAALVAAPDIMTMGLTGLSGIAHGLMAVVAMELVRERKSPWMGIAMLWVLVAKSIYEALSGHVLLEFMHMGMCGTPLAVCHAGGVLGGMLGWMIVNRGLPRSAGTTMEETDEMPEL